MTRPFRYLADPLCIASLLAYAINRWLLRPHDIGGAFAHAYVNDLLCLPLLLPMILYAQRRLHLRRHDGPPSIAEVVQHALVFALVFEVINPRYPALYDTVADAFDALAYFAGGLAAWVAWRRIYLKTTVSPSSPCMNPPVSAAPAR